MFLQQVTTTVSDYNLTLETILSIVIGVGLSAASGFRVFVPLLLMSLAAMYGHLPLKEDFQWIGSYPALMAFTAATVLEIIAYYIPWLDNLLDLFFTPLAIAVGTLMAFALVPEDMDSLLKWTIALIAGGGSAGLVKFLTNFTRLSSTTLTGGIGNPVVSTGEALLSVAMSFLAIFVPVVGLVLVVVSVILLIKRDFFRKPDSTNQLKT